MDKTMKENERSRGQREYPGITTDRADNDIVTKQEVEERTRTQNNNPRNSDKAMPTRQ